MYPSLFCCWFGTNSAFNLKPLQFDHWLIRRLVVRIKSQVCLCSSATVDWILGLKIEHVSGFPQLPQKQVDSKTTLGVWNSAGQV